MKLICISILLSLCLCSEKIINFKTNLEIINAKVIDKAIKDSEYDIPLKTFLLHVGNHSSIDIDINILKKRTIRAGEDISNSFVLDRFTKYSTKSQNKNTINYYLSEPIFMRGVKVIQVAVSPYYYNQLSGDISLYDEFEVVVNVDEVELNSEIPLSADFNQLISSLVVNYNSNSREINLKPCILFICGGNSLDQSSLQELIQWRKELGYEVHAVEVSDIGSSTGAIVSYIQDAYNNWLNPPEHIVLVGDTSGSYEIPYFSTTWGASDYDYTLIEGDDLFPEMSIGRISANGSTDLANIINKTLIYEKASYMDFTGSGWYERAALNADPSSSGNSTIITNEYIEELLMQNGFDDVQTNYGSGNYANWMQNQLSEGILYFNYRGYIGTSGFGSGNINNANNGFMNPFATFITCSTGDFNYTSLSEDFIRAGSVTDPKGAVAAVGTATSSTHTAPNNIVQMGIYEGIFSKGLETAGAALVNGKITLYNTYISGSSSTVDNFTHWNNLMGDPVLKLWTDTPSQIMPGHPDLINWGTNYIEITALDSDGVPIQNAWITLSKDEWSQSLSACSDMNGLASFYIDYSNTSDITVTISKRNHVPYQSVIPVSDNQTEILINSYYVEDSSSENDDSINAGETLNLFLEIESSMFLNQGAFTASINSLSDNVEMVSSSIDFNLQESNILGPFTLSTGYIIDNEVIDLHLNISDDWSSWDYLLSFTSSEAFFDLSNFEWDGGNVAPNSSSALNLSIINNGSEIIDSQLQVLVYTENNLVDIINAEQIFNEAGINEVLVLEPITVSFNNNIINGSNISFFITVSSDDFMQTIPFDIITGSVNQNDPLGPDSYGYFIYDMYDYGYDLMPDYNWIEIDPNEGGQGIDLQISDGGNGNNIANSTKYVDLPFEFSFYGELYNQISVSANGWLSFGQTNMESFRNYPIPGAGGPSPMIAAFWDDLVTNNQSGVYYFYNEDEQFFIIEWSNMRTFNQNSLETFQIILYDSVTPTGDDEIKIQYKEFNNTSSSNSYHPVYSTVGIENHTGNIGLEYTFNNQYPIAANILTDESALFITTRNTNVYNLGDVNQDDSADILDIILIVNHILNVQSLSNLGEYLADVNQNSLINILDVILLINLILET